MIIVNADDWGRSEAETNAALECYSWGTVTSATAMVFMADSERAAGLARDAGISIGLHLNLSERFTGLKASPVILGRHERILRYLKSSKYALLLYNPLLKEAFEVVYHAQVNEFLRLYGKPPSHIDGHQHMHLCTNMLINPLIPKGTKVRRSFSFWAGEKSTLNRCYRRLVDWSLARRYRLTDYFFALSRTLEPSSAARLIRLARGAKVELETHPVISEEREFLLSDGFSQALKELRKVSYDEI